MNFEIVSEAEAKKTPNFYNRKHRRNINIIYFARTNGIVGLLTPNVYCCYRSFDMCVVFSEAHTSILYRREQKYDRASGYTFAQSNVKSQIACGIR